MSEVEENGRGTRLLGWGFGVTWVWLPLGVLSTVGGLLYGLLGRLSQPHLHDPHVEVWQLVLLVQPYAGLASAMASAIGGTSLLISMITKFLGKQLRGAELPPFPWSLLLLLLNITPWVVILCQQ